MRVADLLEHHRMPTVKEEFVVQDTVSLVSEQTPGRQSRLRATRTGKDAVG